MSSEYSSAMALVPKSQELLLGAAVLFGLALMVLLAWREQKVRWCDLGTLAIVAAGVAVAWKEGFVRPDIHVVVFFLYSFALAALLPGLLTCGGSKLPTNSSGEPIRSGGSQSILAAAAVVLFLSLFPLLSSRKDFGVTVQKVFLPRFADSFTAIFAPTAYKTRLEEQLEVMRARMELPHTQTAAGSQPVAVLGFDQEVAILNGLNYVPHPVFQNYSAYTPQLQRLNSSFFNSHQAPGCILWRPTALDQRFPTLDDGEVLLKLLSDYSPALQEKGFVLWRRNDEKDHGYSITKGCALDVPVGNWVQISDKPTWLRVDLQRTLPGKILNLLRAAPLIRIETRFDDGSKMTCRLVPGAARHGFLLSPLLQPLADDQLNRWPVKRVVAVRIQADNSALFERTVHLLIQPIDGLSKLEFARTETQATNLNEN
jgi:hypothetical protein